MEDHSRPAVGLLGKNIESGTAVLLSNSARKNSRPIGIGAGLPVKVNANIGTSPDACDPALELKKARLAVGCGADTVMDLSTAGNLDAIRRKILAKVKAPIGTVPIYQAAVDTIGKGGSIIDMEPDALFETIEKHAKDGVDFITVHCGVTKRTVEQLKKRPRVTGIVSRGGTFLAAWMLHNNKENPLYEEYGRLLEIAAKYNVTLSLGDGLRPGCIEDASDWAQISELKILGRLVERARKAGVQAMVEGPGHLPLDQIEMNVLLEKKICKGAPFYVLGPLVTDIAPGYDHIVGAIGGAIAAVAGADFLCFLTPSEHLGLPTLDGVREGTIASKIAAHAADIVRLGLDGRDRKMGRARAKVDWQAQFRLALDPKKAKELSKKSRKKAGGCTMCGNYCTYKVMPKQP